MDLVRVGKGAVGKEEEVEIGLDCEMEEGDMSVVFIGGIAVGITVDSVVEFVAGRTVVSVAGVEVVSNK